VFPTGRLFMCPQCSRRLLFGGVVLRKVTPKLSFLSPSPTSCNLADKNYRTTVATLVNQLGLTAINLHPGKMIPASRWTSFTLILLSAVSFTPLVVREYAFDKVQENSAQGCGSGARGAGGRISPSDVREWKNAVTSVNERRSSAESGC